MEINVTVSFISDALILLIQRAHIRRPTQSEARRENVQVKCLEMRFKSR